MSSSEFTKICRELSSLADTSYKLLIISDNRNIKR